MSTVTQPTIEQLFDEAGQRYCVCANLALICSERDPSREVVQRGTRALLRLAKQHPAGIAMMVLVPEDAAPPSAEARAAIRESYVAMASILGCVVVVLEGEGFAAATKRSVMTIINVASALPYPTKVVANVHEGATLLPRIMGTSLDPRLTYGQIMAAAAYARGARTQR